MQRQIFINVGLLFISLTVVFILSEIAVRVFSPAPRNPFVFDSVIGYKYQANSEVSFFVQGKEVKNKVNSLGFLDDNHSFEKNAETYRIVFIGDSFLAAINVLRQNTFPKLLEKRLSEISEREIEVINLGLGGFGTAHEYLTLKEYGIKLNPDLTILAFTNNDVIDNFAELGTNIDPGFEFIDEELRQTKFPSPLRGGGTREFISDHFQLPRFLVQKLYKFSIAKNLFLEMNLISAAKDLPGEEIPFGYKILSPEFENDKDIERMWKITKALMSQTKELAEENDSKFLAVILAAKENTEFINSILAKYPGLGSVDSNTTLKILSSYFEENGIDYVDLRGYVDDIEEEIVYPIEDNGHYNLAGHQMVANAIFDYFKNENLLKERSETD